MHTNRIFYALSLAITLVTPVSLAQYEAEQPESDRYEVEIIVFRHLDRERNTPEIPPLPFPPDDDDNLSGVSRAPNQQLAKEPLVNFYIMDLHPQSPDFQAISGTDTGLDSVYRRLERLDAYQPLLQLGWTQRVTGESQAEQFEIPPSVTDQTSVSGTVTLYRERYVHLRLDLQLAESGFGETAVSLDGAVLLPAHIQQSRRIRGANTHYFDHPQFGVIAKVRKLEPAVRPGVSEIG
jgi:hypothetical protein